jgi:hypothetical protein
LQPKTCKSPHEFLYSKFIVICSDDIYIIYERILRCKNLFFIYENVCFVDPEKEYVENRKTMTTTTKKKSVRMYILIEIRTKSSRILSDFFLRMLSEGREHRKYIRKKKKQLGIRSAYVMKKKKEEAHSFDHTRRSWTT